MSDERLTHKSGEVQVESDAVKHYVLFQFQGRGGGGASLSTCLNMYFTDRIQIEYSTALLVVFQVQILAQ